MFSFGILLKGDCDIKRFHGQAMEEGPEEIVLKNGDGLVIGRFNRSLVEAWWREYEGSEAPTFSVPLLQQLGDLQAAINFFVSHCNIPLARKQVGDRAFKSYQTLEEVNL